MADIKSAVQAACIYIDTNDFINRLIEVGLNIEDGTPLGRSVYGTLTRSMKTIVDYINPPRPEDDPNVNEDIVFDKMTSYLESIESIDEKEIENYLIRCKKEMGIDDKKAILIYTDGYTICTSVFDNRQLACEAMNDAYRSNMANVSIPDFEDMCEINDDSAIVYNNGENVFVWQIITIS